MSVRHELQTKTVLRVEAGYSPAVLSICRAYTGDSGDDLVEIKAIAAHN